MRRKRKRKCGAHVLVGIWQQHQHFDLIKIELKWIKWKTIYFFLIFLWIYFLLILGERNFANLIKFQKVQKISTSKSLSQWSIRLNAIYDALIKVLISSWYSHDSITGSLSTARKNNKLMLEMTSWFLLFWHIFSRILYALFYKGWIYRLSLL